MPSERRLLLLDNRNNVAATVCRMAASSVAEHADDASSFLMKVRSRAPTPVMADRQLAGRDGVEVLHLPARIGCTAAVISISALGKRIVASSARAAVEHGHWLVVSLSDPFLRFGHLTLLASRTDQVDQFFNFFPMDSEAAVERRGFAWSGQE